MRKAGRSFHRVSFRLLFILAWYSSSGAATTALYVDLLIDGSGGPPLQNAVIVIDGMSATNPEFKKKKPSDFIDTTLLGEMENEGFFSRLHGGQESTPKK